MGLTVRIYDEVNPVFRGAMRTMGDFRRPLRLCGAQQYRSFLEQFRDEGRPKWTPLAPSTQRRRIRKLPRYKRSKNKRGFTLKPGDVRILQDNGHLRRSYTARTGDSIYELTNYQLAIGSNLPYARIHQLSGWAGKNHAVYIPARSLSITTEDRKTHRTIFQRYIRDSFKQNR